MNGPQHYAEAERLLAESANHPRQYETELSPEADRMIAEAHVHALLAMTAAYALCAPVCDDPTESAGHPSQEHYEDWVEVIEIGERDYEGVAFGGTTDPSIVSQQNAENAR